MLRILFLLLPAALAAQTVFVVRHAERTGDPDPPLNQEGRARAQGLANVLADAAVTHVFASDTIRAQETGAPTALAAKIEVETYAQTAIAELIDRIRAVAKAQESILVVGHRATVPQIVKALGVNSPPPLRSDEHDRLIVVTLPTGGKPQAVSLRYKP